MEAVQGVCIMLLGFLKATGLLLWTQQSTNGRMGTGCFAGWSFKSAKRVCVEGAEVFCVLCADLHSSFHN